MKTTLRNLKLLVIDEVSMVSSLNLAYIHMRLQEVFGGHTWFGGKNVLFVGDLLQLQPVNGSPVFEQINRKTIQLRLGCLGTVSYDELSINERQKKDEQFTLLLNSVRQGLLSDEIEATLRSRVFEESV